MSNLLKFARVQGNDEFVTRVTAAMLIRAREIALWELGTEQRAMVTYINDNPLVPIPAMVTAVAVNATVIGNVDIAEGVADASGVPDADIQFAVNESFEAVALKAFATS